MCLWSMWINTLYKYDLVIQYPVEIIDFEVIFRRCLLASQRSQLKELHWCIFSLSAGPSTSESELFCDQKCLQVLMQQKPVRKQSQSNYFFCKGPATIYSELNQPWDEDELVPWFELFSFMLSLKGKTFRCLVKIYMILWASSQNCCRFLIISLY